MSQQSHFLSNIQSFLLAQYFFPLSANKSPTYSTRQKILASFRYLFRRIQNFINLQIDLFQLKQLIIAIAIKVREA